MADASSLIVANVKAFAKDITDFLDKKRDAKIAALKKAADPKGDEKLVTVSFKLSTGKGSVSRTPQQQAQYVSDGKSWTCAGSHMADTARHVAMYYGAAGKKAKISWDVAGAFGSKDQHFVTLAELKKKWKTLMARHDLKNHKGKDGWGDGDAFHFELEDSKVPRGDKKVAACLTHYAKITRLEGAKKNSSFESGSWKKDVAPYIKVAEKEKARQDEETRTAEIRKLRFAASASGSETLISKGKKSTTVRGKPFEALTFPGPIDAGAEKTRKFSALAGMTWDSLGRDLFEKLGLAETKGFDIKLSCGVDYELVGYANLSQKFLHSLTPHCALVYNTPAARFMEMTVKLAGSVALGEGDDVPKGQLVFNVTLKTPLKTENSRILVDIKGDSAVAKVK